MASKHASRGAYSILLFLSLVLPSACGGSAGPAPQAHEGPPNVILIMADDAGLGDFSCYGSPRLATPHVDRLAREGMRFTQHYAGSPFCAPTRCSLLTGKHTGASTVRGNNLLRLAKGETTLAELFQSKGYVTACIGKWGLGDGNSGEEPLRHGFDTYIGLTNQQLFEERYFPEFMLTNGKPTLLEGNADGGRQTYGPDFLLEASLAFLREHQNEAFFLYLPLLLPHAPHVVPRDAAKAAADRLPELDPNSKELAYAAMIGRLDDHVGRLLEELDSLDLSERTMLIFTSDNGATADGIDPRVLGSNMGQRGHKGQLFEGGIRAPLVVRWPGHVQAGSESDHLSAFWDQLPTLAELIGCEIPRASTGLSFLPTLLGQAELQAQPEYLYWELSEPHVPARDRGLQALRMGSWKAVRLNVTQQPEAPILLFDLSTPAGESRDVSLQHPDVVASMADLMRAAHRPNKRFPLLPSELEAFGNGAWKDLRFQ